MAIIAHGQYSIALKNVKHYGAYFTVSFVVCSCIMLIVNEVNFQTQIPLVVTYIFNSIFPYNAFYGLIELMCQQSAKGNPLSFSNLHCKNVCSGRALLLWQVEQIVLWLLFYVLMTSCRKRAYGKLQLGPMDLENQP